MENEKTIYEQAVEKMRAELADKEAFGKARTADALHQIMEKVVRDHLLKRCKEDEGLASDVMQEHKTLKRCGEYIFDEARKMANKMQMIGVEDARVYEWAEDYFRMDDEEHARAEMEREAKEEAERKAKAQKQASEKKAKKKTEKTAKAEPDAKKDAAEQEAPAEPKEKKPKKQERKKDEIEGQMDLFSLLG